MNVFSYQLAIWSPFGAQLQPEKQKFANNTFQLEQNGHYFADDTFELIFVRNNFVILIQTLLRFVLDDKTDNVLLLDQMIAD